MGFSNSEIQIIDKFNIVTMNTLSRKQKIQAIVGSLILITCFQLISYLIMKNKNHINQSICLFDNFRDFTMGFTHYLKKYPMVTTILTAVDSLIIDIVLLVFLFFYITEGIKPFVFSYCIFYTLRFCCFPFAGQWPLPKPYFFSDPGLPSLFIPYLASNDLYFSGHIGNITIICILCYYFLHYGLGNAALLLLFYTAFFMTVTGGHFTNDMIIGVVCGSLAGYIGIKLMYSLTYSSLLVYCNCLSALLITFKGENLNNCDQTIALTKKENDTILDIIE